MGAHAINGWVATRAHNLIVAKADAAAAVKALAKVEADLAVLTKGRRRGRGQDGRHELAPKSSRSSMPSTSRSPSSPACGRASRAWRRASRSSPRSRPRGPTSSPLLAVRAAAIEAATAAVAAANAATAAAMAGNQPPTAPSVVAVGAVTAADVDVGAMSSAEKRVLLARLLGPGGMGDEQGNSVGKPPTARCLLGVFSVAY